MKNKFFALAALCLMVFGLPSCSESVEISNKNETDVELEIGSEEKTLDLLVGEWTGKFFTCGEAVSSFDNFKIEILNNKDIKVYERKGDTYVECKQLGSLTEQKDIYGTSFIVNLSIDEKALGIDYRIKLSGRDNLIMESLYEGKLCRIEFDAVHSDYISEIKGFNGGSLDESAQLKFKEDIAEILNEERWNDISRGTAICNFKNALKKVIETIQTEKLYDKYKVSGNLNIDFVVYDKYSKTVVKYNTILVTESSSTLK